MKESWKRRESGCDENATEDVALRREFVEDHWGGHEKSNPGIREVKERSWAKDRMV